MREMNTNITSAIRATPGKTRRKLQALGIGCLLLAAGALPALAQEPSPADRALSWGSEVTFGSRYVWRGFLLNDSVSFQPAAWVTFKELTISSWSNVSKDAPFSEHWTEHDLTVDYTHGFDNGFSVSGGYINYAFPDLPADQLANEVYGAIGYDGSVSTGFGVYQNFGLSTGTYLVGSLSKEIPAGRKLSLTPSFGIGYNREMFIPDSTFSDAVFGVSATIPLGARFTVTPSVSFSKSLDNTFFDDHWFGGITFGWSN